MNQYEELIEEAKKARLRAYAPYSKFLVGAAALLDDGTYVHGCNVENISYGLTNCAERSLIFGMISNGISPKKIKMFCIIGQTDAPISPCGACRQVLFEHLEENTPIVLANLEGDYVVYRINELLPYVFKEIENVE